MGALFLFDLGYFKLQAWYLIAAAGAYFLTRLNHQTNLCTAGARGMQPLVLAQVLKTVEDNMHEQHVFGGPKSWSHHVLLQCVCQKPSSTNAGESRRKMPRKKATRHPNLICYCLSAATRNCDQTVRLKL